MNGLNFVLGLNTISQQDVVELISQAAYRDTKIKNKIPPVLIQEIEQEKVWAIQDYDTEYVNKMNQALELVHGWYQKYPTVVEIKINHFENTILKQIASWEELKMIDVLYVSKDDGEELKTRIFD